MSREGQVYGSGGSQVGSMEPAYKKTKLAHLRVKVPGGVRIKTWCRIDKTPCHVCLSCHMSACCCWNVQADNVQP